MMNNFFRPSHGNERPPARSMLKRAAFFAAGLVLLWVAVELMPTTTASAPVVQETNEGSVAYRSDRSTPLKPGMIFAGLILIGGVIVAVALRRQSVGTTSDTCLETLADMPIAADQRLRLVRCGNDVLLLGITSGGVNVLEKYHRETFAEGSAPAALRQSANGYPAGQAFADILRDAAGRYRSTHTN
jgi:flagellar protein FliO/FliZ